VLLCKLRVVVNYRVNVLEYTAIHARFTRIHTNKDQIHGLIYENTRQYTRDLHEYTRIHTNTRDNTGVKHDIRVLVLTKHNENTRHILDVYSPHICVYYRYVLVHITVYDGYFQVLNYLQNNWITL